MGLDTSIASGSQGTEAGTVSLNDVADLFLPTKWQVRSWHNLDKVHEVEIRVAGVLASTVERI